MTSPLDKALEHSDEQLSTAIQLFIDHKITLVQAAHLVGLPASEMMDELAERKIPVVDYSKEELLEELEQFSRTDSGTSQ